jgi:hypothetical protein
MPPTHLKMVGEGAVERNVFYKQEAYLHIPNHWFEHYYKTLYSLAGYALSSEDGRRY